LDTTKPKIEEKNVPLNKNYKPFMSHAQVNTTSQILLKKLTSPIVKTKVMKHLHFTF
jgi:hypothetical protein